MSDDNDNLNLSPSEEYDWIARTLEAQQHADALDKSWRAAYERQQAAFESLVRINRVLFFTVVVQSLFTVAISLAFRFFR